MVVTGSCYVGRSLARRVHKRKMKIPKIKYGVPRALIESRKGGGHVFQSEGILTRQQMQVQPNLIQQAIQDERQFEGWRHKNV